MVWEGQSLTLFNLLILKDVLNELKDEVELHIITDFHYYKYANKYGKTEASNILKDIICDKYFYEWKKETFNEQIIQCDLAIIPIDTSNGLQKGKPENKLILFWLMGMPVLTSSTPAYERTMKLSDINMQVDSLKSWKQEILKYKSSQNPVRQLLGSNCFDYAKKKYCREQITSMWDCTLIHF